MTPLAESAPQPQVTTASGEEERERREFRHTFSWVTGVHLFALLLFFLAGFLQPRKRPEQVTWLLGGEVGGGETATAADAAAAGTVDEVISEPPQPQRVPDPPVAPPPRPSELVILQATPAPATPKPATPKPATPKPTTTPKPATPKPETPKPATPKPLAKATPKKAGTPKPSAVAVKAKATPNAAKIAAKTEANGNGAGSAPARSGAAGAPASGSGKGTGKVGSGPGSGAPSDFGAYFALLRDRYYAVWNQPTSLDRAAGDLITTLRIKAQRDGTVLSSEIVKSSGNSVMDGSVLAAAEQVTKIDPLPKGLGREEVLEIPINFKLDQGQ